MCKSIASDRGLVIRLQFVTRDSSTGPDIQTILERSSSIFVSFTPHFVSSLLTPKAIFMIAVSPAANGYVRGQAYKALYATILGSFFLAILLMFISGLTLQERPGAKKRYEKNNHWEEYSRYLNRTSILIPFPPQIYEKLPTILKRTIFLEFPIYVFDPAKHSDAGKGQRAAEEGDGHKPSTTSTNNRQSGDQLVSSGA
jgi:hypothetical protein